MIPKFRAWLKKENRMIDPVIGLDLSQPYQTIQWFETTHDALSSNVSDCFMDECELMQYKLLKDKNGKEYCEDDIAEYKYINPLNGEEVFERYKIKTGDNSLIKLMHQSGEQRWDRYLYMQHDKLEIVGNIYENPELLEVTP